MERGNGESDWKEEVEREWREGMERGSGEEGIERVSGEVLLEKRWKNHQKTHHPT